MDLNPRSVIALQWHGIYLAMVAGRFDEAFAAARRAVDADPLSAYSHVALGGAHMCHGRYQEAEAAFRRAVELDPVLWVSYRNLGICLSCAGKYDEALATLERGDEMSGHHPWMIVTRTITCVLAGRLDDAERFHDALLALSRQQYVQPMMMASSYGAIDRLDEAFDWLERGYRERDPLPLMNYWPQVPSAARKDPRFAALMKRVGVPLAPDLR